jgi:hypothetical protein
MRETNLLKNQGISPEHSGISWNEVTKHGGKSRILETLL